MTKHNLNAVQRALATSHAAVCATDTLTEACEDVLAQSRLQVQLAQNSVARSCAALSVVKERDC